MIFKSFPPIISHLPMGRLQGGQTRGRILVLKGPQLLSEAEEGAHHSHLPFQICGSWAARTPLPCSTRSSGACAMTSPKPQLSPEPQTPFRPLSFLLVSPLGRTKPTREQAGSIAPHGSPLQTPNSGPGMPLPHSQPRLVGGSGRNPSPPPRKAVSKASGARRAGEEMQSVFPEPGPRTFPRRRPGPLLRPQL